MGIFRFMVDTFCLFYFIQLYITSEFDGRSKKRNCTKKETRTCEQQQQQQSSRG